MLSQKQLRAVESLAKGSGKRATGKLVGVSHVTISRWLNNPEFREALKKAEESLKQTHQEILDTYKEALLQSARYSNECIEIIMSIARSEDTRTSDRLKACEMVMSKPERLIDIIEDEKLFPEDAASYQENLQEWYTTWSDELSNEGWMQIGVDTWLEPEGGSYPIICGTEQAYRELLKRREALKSTERYYQSLKDNWDQPNDGECEDVEISE